MTLSTRDGPSRTLPVVVDTGSGPNLIDETWLEENLNPEYKPVTDAKLHSSGNDPLVVDRTAPLIVQMGSHRSLVWFGVIKELAVPALLGTSYLDRCIQSISPAERIVTPVKSGPVPINGMSPDEVDALRQVCSITKTIRDRHGHPEFDHIRTKK